MNWARHVIDGMVERVFLKMVYFERGPDAIIGYAYIRRTFKAESMHIATCITSHDSIAKARVPQQCCYWSLDLKSANLLATAIALEDDDEPIICTTGKQ